ncbi:HlyD family secretion protein, partial [Burkholderia sp. IO2]|nr:HlyD family secretion protein [Burkholderia sp. IO2]
MPDAILCPLSVRERFGVAVRRALTPGPRGTGAPDAFVSAAAGAALSTPLHVRWPTVVARAGDGPSGGGSGAGPA